MTGDSNVGSASVYEAKDQVTSKDSEQREEKESQRFHEGTENSHLATDSKDERSIANKLEREKKREKEEKEDEDKKVDPTAAAISHGNKPSKGAIIDKQIQEEEEEILKKKGSFGPKGS